MSSNWLILILHTRPKSILKDAFETAFPDGRVVSLFRPGLWDTEWMPTGPEMIDWFQRRVFDPGIWRHRVLTVYETGEYHHYTYALSYFAARRRALLEQAGQNWTYFHFDNHRDDYEFEGRQELGFSPYINFANFVDSLAYDHGAIPFLIGPDIYPDHDREGYRIRGTHIPIYSNYFKGSERAPGVWAGSPATKGLMHRGLFTGAEMPSTQDLQATPRNAYLSFDLDVLSPTEMVTDYDQNYSMTLRRLISIASKVMSHKRVFGADILGLPHEYEHPLSVLNIVILARHIMGMGTSRLLSHQGSAKRKQARWLSRGNGILRDPHRPSPINRDELMEILNG